MHTGSALGQRPRQPTRPRRLGHPQLCTILSLLWNNLFWRQAFLLEGTVSSFSNTTHPQQQQQQQMTEPAEQTSILVPTEDLGAVLESFKLPILQNICKSENLDADGGRRELTARIRKRTEEAQPKYQRQKKVLKIAHQLAAEVGPVSYVQSHNLDEILPSI